ncbi:MAG: hypothetical protein WC876_09125 [Candidatus Thermoplasmatota archaeon]|jgi:hypothetical protein
MILDIWSLGHAVWGLFFAWRRAQFWAVVGIAFAWEWFENTVLVAANWGEPGNPINSVVDVAVAVFACAAAVSLRAFLNAEHGRRLKAAGEALDDWDD